MENRKKRENTEATVTPLENTIVKDGASIFQINVLVYMSDVGKLRFTLENPEKVSNGERN